jgi:hypothetical protein
MNVLYKTDKARNERRVKMYESEFTSRQLLLYTANTVPNLIDIRRLFPVCLRKRHTDRPVVVM